ncbi:very short patch repair endonuclease [Oribacterium sp. NK2B42]|uniref:very short patch repair endonuclease n=1 Tax=Oribacterium sp. NK2B42 TaxID=689781 RepID=UPI0004110E1B|nr:very short patch repair endonuclease [Oribacterium sp. NK2B42]
MADDMIPEQRRRNMQHIRSKDTSIEVKLRTALWHEGIRYRKNYKKLVGKPDIVITKYRIAVFCDGSFWHGRNFDTKKPVDTNHEYWDTKIRRNMARDDEVDKQLKAEGWTVLRFWDAEINKHLEDCVKTIKEAVLDAKNHNN